MKLSGIEGRESSAVLFGGSSFAEFFWMKLMNGAKRREQAVHQAAGAARQAKANHQPIVLHEDNWWLLLRS